MAAPSPRLRASIALDGPVLHYAEVEMLPGEPHDHAAPHYLLRSLGRCDFDWLADADLYGAGAPSYLDTLAAALTDVLGGSRAQELAWVIHPPHALSFFTPVAPRLAERENSDALRDQLTREAEFLDAATGEARYRVTPEIVREERLGEGDPFTWVHALALEANVQERLDRTARVLPHERYRPRLSMEAVARLVGAVEARETARRAPYTLAVGWYGTRTEFVLCRHGRWYHSHHTDAASPQDAAYFAVALLKQLRLLPVAVGRVYAYGPEARTHDPSVLEAVFQATVEPLDPFAAVEMNGAARASSADFDGEAYAPCIGAALLG